MCIVYECMQHECICIHGYVCTIYVYTCVYVCVWCVCDVCVVCVCGVCVWCVVCVCVWYVCVCMC